MAATWPPKTPDYAQRVRESFAKQRIMALFGAELVRVEPGLVDIRLPFRPELTQQHGYLHAAAVTAIVDSACGYAALTLMPAGAEVLTVEFKINLLAPAKGDTFLARGRVVRPGRTITVCAGDVTAHGNDGETVVATMLATMIQVGARD
ncbi:MAG TPA: PaaI family thioesterase [Limnochordales bacterium]